MENSEQSAFPLPELTNGNWIEKINTTGLTKREYFAVKCLQGMMSSAFWSENFTEKEEDRKKAIDIAIKTADDFLKQLGNISE